MYIPHPTTTTPLLQTHLPLQPRNNMGYPIPPALIIFLVILGGGFCVCIGFAVYRFYGPEANEQCQWHNRSPEQDAYMKQVRERNWRRTRMGMGRGMGIGRRGVNGRRVPGQDMAHAPSFTTTTTTYG